MGFLVFSLIGLFMTMLGITGFIVGVIGKYANFAFVSYLTFVFGMYFLITTGIPYLLS